MAFALAFQEAASTARVNLPSSAEVPLPLRRDAWPFARWIGLAVVVALHAVAVALLWHYAPKRTPRVAAAPSIAPTPITAPPVETATLSPPSPAPVEVVAQARESAPPVTMTPPRFDADYLRNPAPLYPTISRRNGEQGRVLLRVLVGADGAPQDIQVKMSSGIERLDRAAHDAVRLWKFVPARVGADAVAAWVLVPIAFTLQG